MTDDQRNHRARVRQAQQVAALMVSIAARVEHSPAHRIDPPDNGYLPPDYGPTAKRGGVMTDFYEDDEPIEKIRHDFGTGEHGVTAPPWEVTGDVYCWPPGLVTNVSPEGLTLHDGREA